jgi:hypothetical protein
MFHAIMRSLVLETSMAPVGSMLILAAYSLFSSVLNKPVS